MRTGFSISFRDIAPEVYIRPGSCLGYHRGMGIAVTPRALAVLRRALEVARLDPATTGVTVRVVGAGPSAQVQTGFAEEADTGDEIVDAQGIRLFVPASLAHGELTLDVTGEHDRLIVR